jgi:hypothetical protein
MMTHPRIRRQILLAILALLLGGCSSQENLKFEIVVSNPPCEISPGGTVSMSLDGEIPAEAEVQWEVGIGTLSKEKGLSTSYTPSEVVLDTNVRIVARVTANGRTISQSIDCLIKGNLLITDEPTIASTVLPTSTTSIPTTSESPLPTFVCGTGDFASHYIMYQIAQDKLDEQNGFHLELILLGLETNYPLSEVYRKIESGEWDCYLDTLDTPPVFGNYMVITAIIDESAGADQVWVRGENINTINDFKGHRISVWSDSPSLFMLYALLDLAGLTKDDITLVGAPSQEEAVAMFNEGKADIVLGWAPGILKAEDGGGRKFVDSSELRYIVDVVGVSQHAIDTKPNVVQAFHRAWFQALKAQIDNPVQSAQSIATWGHNDWTGIYPDTAEADLRSQLSEIAQAGYGPNFIIMQNPEILYERIRHVQSVATRVGINISPSFDVEAAVNPQFVLALQQDDSTIKSIGEPINPSFAMSGEPPYPKIERWYPIATLPCEQFEFLPGSVTLTDESQRTLEECALPILRASTLYLHITASSAWPGPDLYSKEQIESFAKQRALAIAQYLSNRGVDLNRLITDFVLPPPERQGILIESELEKDRYVRLELVTGGLK